MKKPWGLQSWRWMIRSLRKYGRQTAILCGTAILSGAGTVMLALVVRQVVNAGFSGRMILFWAALLLALCAGILVLGLWHRWYSGRLRDRMIWDLRHQILEILLSRSYEELAPYHTGDLVSRLGEDVAILCGEATALLPAVTGSVVRLLGVLAALIWLDRTLALVLAGVGVALGLGAALLRIPMRQRSREIRSAESRVRTGIQECMDNRESAKGLGMEQELLSRERRLLDQALEARDRQRTLSLAASGGLEAVSQAGYCIVLIWWVVMAAKGAMTFGTLTAVLQLLVQLRGPVMTLSGIIPRLSAATACAERLGELSELPEEEAAEALPAGIQPRALVFSHVDFQYPDDERPVLRDFSLRVETGNWTCLTGPSGKGKSTVFKLALGFYRPQGGEVYLETDWGKITCGKAARRFFGYVPQNYALFSGTVRENLLLADPEADDEKLWAALEAACGEFVRDLPQGLDTPLREHGGGISEGQGQRLALTRALLLDTPFLLLDECTSALDWATEKAVLRRLREYGRGALLVSHHPDTLPAETLIISMEDEV